METDDYTDAAAAAWSERLGPDEVSTMAITMRLRRLVRVLDLEVAAVIQASPLSAYGDYQVLALLHRSDRPLQPKEIAQMLQLTRSGTTGRLERLTASGLVERVAHPRDGRSALVAVTAEGSRLADELFRAAQDVESVAFASLSDDDRAHLVSSLRRILLELDDTVDGEPGG